jgi:hypothetical protein
LRYNIPVYFQRKQKGAYNADTGNYGPETVVEVKRYASVTDTGTDTLNLVYGGPKQGSLTIRLQRPYTEPFDQIRIGDGEQAKCYGSDKARLFKRVFIVSEVQ